MIPPAVSDTVRKAQDMSRKKVIVIAMVIGSVAGGYAPTLFGADSLFLSLAGSTLGGLLGIWVAFKLYDG